MKTTVEVVVCYVYSRILLCRSDATSNGTMYVWTKKQSTKTRIYISYALHFQAISFLVCEEWKKRRVWVLIHTKEFKIYNQFDEDVP